jgi:hypothetical protein
MHQKPDFFIADKKNSINHENIKSLSNSIHKIIFELSNITKEISFLIIPEENILEYN